MTHFIIDRFYLLFQGIILFQIVFFAIIFIINRREDVLYYCLMNLFSSAYFFLNAPNTFFKIEDQLIFNSKYYEIVNFSILLLIILMYLLFLREIFKATAENLLLNNLFIFTCWSISVIYLIFIALSHFKLTTSLVFFAAHLINGPYVSVLIYQNIKSKGFKALIIKGILVVFVCFMFTILFTIRYNLGLREVIFDAYPLFFIRFGILIDIFLFQIALLKRWNEQEKELITKDYESKLAIVKVKNQISQELHDNVGANLNSLNFLVELLRKKPAEDHLLQKMQSTISETSMLINDTIWALNPSYDSLQKVFERIKNFATVLLSSNNIALGFIIDPELKFPSLTIEKRRQLYLTMKEAINNIAKHAHARKVTIKIHETLEFILVDISDDGVGFNLDETQNGNGFLNFRNRQIDGILITAVFSKIDEGTQIEIRLKK